VHIHDMGQRRCLGQRHGEEEIVMQWQACLTPTASDGLSLRVRVRAGAPEPHSLELRLRGRREEVVDERLGRCACGAAHARRAPLDVRVHDRDGRLHLSV